MKYNIRDNVSSDDLIAHFILHTMGPLFQGKSPIPFKAEEGVLEIEVKLNGLEVDPKTFFDHLSRECERWADERAEEKLEEPLGPLYRSLDELRDKVEAAVKDAVRQHLPKAARRTSGECDLASIL